MIYGAVAQLGARLHGMQKVRGSNPLSSTLKGLLFYTAGLFAFLIVASFRAGGVSDGSLSHCYIGGKLEI